MAIDILYDPVRCEGCLCSSTTGQAFGPVLTGIASREQLEQFARVADQHLAAGGDPESLPDLLEQYQTAEDWPVRSQFQCLHCEAVVDPQDVKRAMDAASWHLFDGDVRAACPACGQGDGDFEEIEICSHCGGPTGDRLVHIGECPARPTPSRQTKPPLPSVSTFSRRIRRRLA